MKTIEERAKEYSCRENLTYIVFPISKFILCALEEMALIEGVKIAQEWISVEDELPKIKEEPYQVIGKLAVNGQCETYWIEHNTANIEKECTHWRPIERK